MQQHDNIQITFFYPMSWYIPLHDDVEGKHIQLTTVSDGFCGPVPLGESRTTNDQYNDLGSYGNNVTWMILSLSLCSGISLKNLSRFSCGSFVNVELFTLDVNPPLTTIVLPILGTCGSFFWLGIFWLQ